jgi:hypothetical protein
MHGITAPDKKLLPLKWFAKTIFINISYLKLGFKLKVIKSCNSSEHMVNIILLFYKANLQGKCSLNLPLSRNCDGLRPTQAIFASHCSALKRNGKARWLKSLKPGNLGLDS